MNQNLFDELRKLRNEIAHGAHGLNPAELAKRLSKMGLSVPAADLPEFTTLLLQVFGGETGLHYVPQTILTVLTKLLDGRSANIVCDPWAGIGTVLASVRETTQATRAIAFTKNSDDAELGRVLLSSADWRVGDPCQLLSTLSENLDVVASVLPFGVRGIKPIDLQTADGTRLILQDDLGHQILAASSLKISVGGIGLFVIPQSFFTSQRSVFRQFDTLGLGISAALALPSGAFAPYTNISTYLVVIKKSPSSRMFVAQLSTDTNTDLQIIENYKQGLEGATLDLGRFVETASFTAIGALRASERLQRAEDRFGYPALPLEDIAASITLGRPGNEFAFPRQENAVYVPLIGSSDVVESVDDMTLKPKSYALVAIDPTRSDARFVARFLNSEFGREILELSKSGFIPRLNKQSLNGVRVFIPDLRTQREMLAVEARITVEENTLLGLRNELAECRRQLWKDPGSKAVVSKQLDSFSSRLSRELKEQTIECLEQWFESLPFPMASILRAWQATPSDDFKTKHEHLLHFFEASTEFLGIILLSAFSSREQFFYEIKKDLADALKRHNLSLKRATFGTWKMVVEYLGKQVRKLLSGENEESTMCGDMFADPSMHLPEVLSRKELIEIISTTNKMRNDWTGHGGVVGQEEAHLRNEKLLTEVQKFWEAIGDLWSTVQLVHALHCRPRRGLFETEIAVLMGSNSEFLKETRPMPTSLDVERLYLVRGDTGRVLQLLPLVHVGSSPSSAKNACYFYSRIEKDGLRYVSYHFIDQPERKYPIEDAHEILTLLQENGEI